MRIEVQDRRSRPPKEHTHEVRVDGVSVGFGTERSLAGAVAALRKDPTLALALREAFENEPEEW